LLRRFGLAKSRDVAYAVEARQRIRNALEALPIFARPLEQSLYHYCAVLDVEEYKAQADPLRIFSAGRAAVESSIRAIPELFARCPRGQTEPRMDQALFSEAYELFAFTRTYEQVAFSFELADRGQFEIHIAKLAPRITFTYSAVDSDNVDTLLRSGELLEHLGLAEEKNTDQTGMLAAISAVRAALDGHIRFTSSESITYDYTPDLTARVSEWANLLESAIPWRLSPKVMFGSVSFGEVRRFWAALVAISNTHDAAHLMAGEGDIHKWPISSRVLLHPQDQFKVLLSAISGLTEQSAATIFEWLIFDPRISAKTPVLQPFLPIAPQLLAVPSLFVTTTDFERNFLRLINRHPALLPYADAVKKSKEPLALAQIAALFPEPAYRTKPQVLLPKTDADLVVWERATGLVIVIQHKWLIGPDTASESASNDEELNKGVRQAVLARDYWRAAPDELRRSLSLPDEAAITQIEACVISRGSEPTGFVKQPAVPVASEKALVALFNRERTLTSLWKLLTTRPDQIESAKQTREVRFTVDLAGYQFVIPGLAM
jgi:hypothetical protein